MGVECRGCGAYLVRSTWVEMRGHLCPTCSGESLDAAWAEAEAALPEGSYMGVQTVRDGQARAWATMLHPGERSATGPTPAAALRALAAKLREREG